MPNPSHAIRRLRPFLDEHPRLKQTLKNFDDGASRARGGLAAKFPGLIKPQPRQLTIAITAQCNFRCIGCRYGRDFMVGEQLSLDVVKGVLDDARDAGVNIVRFYGGEPLLHKDLHHMVRHAANLGLEVYVTTNAILLDRRADELVDAGLKWVSMGFYGFGETFDAYTQRPGKFEEFIESVTNVRARHRENLDVQLNYVVVRPLAGIDKLDEAWAFAVEHDLFFHLDLYGYSVPFFSRGPDDELAFLPGDEPMLKALVERLLELKAQRPDRFPHHEAFIRSIPDWVVQCEDMRVPCDAYQLLWIGADGSLQLCDTAFPLGNVNESRLKDLVFTDEHKRAARDGFALKCPNCTCKVDSRIRRHGPSWRRYNQPGSELSGLQERS
ncbi:Cyclic pyranopterin monophosphate synthase [Planctomycetes bacterium Poly30]|uniref:Cyclic pyranopterin monophosphate synthase n=1 Tax=Saltatorellus ferox TaxID=2528018 RepID=A0A518ELT9_9BACT|nr:Cyclic pyranopterin monophosphate synthase [Planctomycetes bacterium Poly30]